MPEGAPSERGAGRDVVTVQSATARTDRCQRRLIACPSDGRRPPMRVIHAGAPPRRGSLARARTPPCGVPGIATRPAHRCATLARTCRNARDDARPPRRCCACAASWSSSASSRTATRSASCPGRPTCWTSRAAPSGSGRRRSTAACSCASRASTRRTHHGRLAQPIGDVAVAARDAAALAAHARRPRSPRGRRGPDRRAHADAPLRPRRAAQPPDRVQRRPAVHRVHREVTAAGRRNSGGRRQTTPVRARKSSSGGRPGSASRTSPARRGSSSASTGTLRRS